MATRREFLRNCGLLTAGSALGGFSIDALAAPAAGAAAGIDYAPLTGIKYPIRTLDALTDKQISYVVVGAGNRGNVYARYAEMFPDKAKVVGVSDINDFRLKRMSDKHGVPAERRFGDYHEIMAAPKMADAMVMLGKGIEPDVGNEQA